MFKFIGTNTFNIRIAIFFSKSIFAGLPESKVKEYCTRAGFKYIKKVPLDNPFNSLYEVKNK